MLNVLSTFRGLLLRCDIFCFYRSLANCLSEQKGGKLGDGLPFGPLPYFEGRTGQSAKVGSG